MGKRLLDAMTDLMNGIIDRKWNTERFIIFQIAILQRSPDVKRATDIRRCITRRLDAWDEGKFSMLVEDTEHTLKRSLRKKQGMSTSEKQAKTFHRKILRGDIRGWCGI